jgi:hypothetical protein
MWGSSWLAKDEKATHTTVAIEYGVAPSDIEKLALAIQHLAGVLEPIAEALKEKTSPAARM